MYIGKVGENYCWVNEHSANGHVCVTGMSGGGKSSRIMQIELEEAKSGNLVCVLDINHGHSPERIFAPIAESYAKLLNQTDVTTDGLGISLLQPIVGKNGQAEDFVSLVNSAVYALGLPLKMGAKQIGVLRDAVIYAIAHLREFPDEMKSIGVGLLQQKNETAKDVYQKLWPLMNCNLIRHSTKYMQIGMINIISFAGLDRITQMILAEIFLSTLWRTVQYQGNIWGKNVILSIDEFHNLSLREGSVLRNILREGRKFGINLLLATQTLNVFPKETLSIINQSATKLYFRPATNEIYNIAKEIESSNVQKWEHKLSLLQVGEAVAVGNLSIGTSEIDHPIITR